MERGNPGEKKKWCRNLRETPQEVVQDAGGEK